MDLRFSQSGNPPNLPVAWHTGIAANNIRRKITISNARERKINRWSEKVLESTSVGKTALLSSLRNWDLRYPPSVDIRFHWLRYRLLGYGLDILQSISMDPANYTSMDVGAEHGLNSFNWPIHILYYCATNSAISNLVTWDHPDLGPGIFPEDLWTGGSELCHVSR